MKAPFASPLSLAHALLERFGCYVRRHAFVQALLFVSLLFSVLNIVYTFMVVAIVRSWLLTWHLDRRFPLSTIPLWAFFLVSLAIFIIGIYYYPRNHPKLRYDKVNGFFICITIILITWVVLALSLTHTLYIADFNVVRILQNALSGMNLLELPIEAIDTFPTLGDTVFIGYSFAFLFLLLAN